MRFGALDAWRGICALMIAVLHLPVVWSFHDSAFIRNSFLLVDFFFVLSGFVISNAYRDKILTARDGVVFVIKRFGRMWPLHVFVLAVFVLTELTQYVLFPWFGKYYPNELFGPERPLLGIVTNFFLINGLGLDNQVTWNGPSWSISTEFFTNLLLLPVLMIGARMGRSVDILLSMLLSGVGAAFLVLFSTRYMNATVEWGFTRCVYGFFVGCLVNHVYYAGHIRTYLRRPGRSLSTLLELGTVAVVVLFVATTGQSAFSYLAPLLFACVVLIFAAEAGGVSLILNMQYFQIIGMLSYSIYMVHFYLKYILQAVVLVFGRLVLELPASSIFVSSDHESLIRFGGPIWMNLLLLFYLTLVLSVSYFTYHLVEQPSRDYFNRLAQRVRQRGVVEAEILTSAETA